MKTTLHLLIALCLLTGAAQATTYTVSVANFQFSPATLSAHVGDTIKFVWSNGSHTTTSKSIPAGAAAWDQPINSSSTSYSYKPAVAGTYSYQCTPHAPDMSGSFTVTAATGVTGVTGAPAVSIYPNPAMTVLHLDFGAVQHAAAISLTEAATGRVILTRTVSGAREADINTGAIPNGSYFLRISSDEGTSLKQVAILH